jgi:hypothetical protein
LDNVITFSTRLIHAESGTYPLTFNGIKARHPQTSFPSEPTAEMLESLGYFVVKPTASPSGDVVTELAPVKNAEGQYEEVYEVRAFNEAELQSRLETRKNEVLTELNTMRARQLEIGAPIDFGGDFGVQHIQLRDGDRANIIGLRIEAQLNVDAGVEEMMGIRTYENVLVPLTPAQVLQVSMTVLASYKVIMGTTWYYQDMIKDALTLADIPSLEGDILAPPTKSVPAPAAPVEPAAEEPVEPVDTSAGE